jgi:hypothetical protein
MATRPRRRLRRFRRRRGPTTKTLRANCCRDTETYCSQPIFWPPKALCGSMYSDVSCCSVIQYLSFAALDFRFGGRRAREGFLGAPELRARSAPRNDVSADEARRTSTRHRACPPLTRSEGRPGVAPAAACSLIGAPVVARDSERARFREGDQNKSGTFVSARATRTRAAHLR